MRKIIITGPDTLDDFNLLKKVCDERIGNDVVEIITGNKTATDKLAERYGMLKDHTVSKAESGTPVVQKFEEMISYADELILFHDNMDKNMQIVMNIAQKIGIDAYVKLFKPQ